jgi:hypothetical protein
MYYRKNKMKKLILLALTALVMVGCFNEKNPDGTYTTPEQRTYIIDSCEYIGYLGFGNCDVIAHKGNCRFCKERRQKELEELVIKLKEK